MVLYVGYLESAKDFSAMPWSSWPLNEGLDCTGLSLNSFLLNRKFPNPAYIMATIMSQEPLLTAWQLGLCLVVYNSRFAGTKHSTSVCLRGEELFLPTGSWAKARDRPAQSCLSASTNTCRIRTPTKQWSAFIIHKIGIKLWVHVLWHYKYEI